MREWMGRNRAGRVVATLLVLAALTAFAPGCVSDEQKAHEEHAPTGAVYMGPPRSYVDRQIEDWRDQP